MVLKTQTKVLLDLIKTRRTINSYASDEIPREMLLEAIEASLWAPNHKLTHPWAFMILDKKQRQLLADVAVKVKEAKEPLNDLKRAAIRKKFESEGSLLLCMRKKTLEEPEVRVNEDRATLSCSIYIMSLFLWSEGYVSKWGTGAVIRSADLFKGLGLSQECIEIVGLFYCGKPTGPLSPPPSRPSLDSVILS